MIIGWLDHVDLRWYLPVHQAVEGNDFMFPEWCGACETCAPHRAPIVCAVCSYDPRSGAPAEPVPYPCPAVRGLPRKPAPGPRTPTEDDGNYRPRPTRGGSWTAEVKARIKGRKF